MPGVIVTGVSRKRGIAAAVAARLRHDGWAVFATGWRNYDLEQHPGDTASAEVDVELDLANPASARALVDAGIERIGPISALVVAHTHDADGGLLDVTAEELDRHLAINIRGSVLLMKEFATAFRGAPGTGRIVVLTSGPPQTGNVAYAASKGALEWVTFSAATELGPRGITVNAVNPGPNQTGWMTADVEREAAKRSPLGRAGRPEDAASLVAFLVSPEAAWINGQVITSDGGHHIAGGSLPRVGDS
jgi:3-oxoacyl-[acyl-carrier protein] reductase